MLPTIGTWMFYRGDGTAKEDNLACLTLSAHAIKVVPISQFIELRHEKDEVFATVTWPSTVKVRKVGA